MSSVRISLSPFDKENKTKYKHYLALRLVLQPFEFPRQTENKAYLSETRNFGFGVPAVTVVFAILKVLNRTMQLISRSSRLRL